MQFDYLIEPSELAFIIDAVVSNDGKELEAGFAYFDKKIFLKVLTLKNEDNQSVNIHVPSEVMNKDAPSFQGTITLEIADEEIINQPAS